MRWKTVIIDDFETNYEVSDNGSVRKKDTKKAVGLNLTKGYHQVTIRVEYKSLYFYRKILVHDLVARAFIPNPENKPVVNHINGIKHDNRVENLEWVSQKENVLHWARVLNGKDRLKQRSDKNNAAVIDNATARKICECISNGDSNLQIASMFGVSSSLVEAIRIRKNWTEISKDYVFPKKNGDRVYDDTLASIFDELASGDLPSFSEIGEKCGVSKDTVRKIFYRKRYRKQSKGILFNPKYFDDTGLIVTALECALRMDDYETSESFLSLESDDQKERFVCAYEWWKEKFRRWRQLNGMD